MALQRSSQLNVMLPLVPMPVIVSAAVTALFGIATIALSKREHLLYPMAMISYFALTLTVGALVVLTGFTSSPFIALWMLISVFAGTFGVRGIGAVAVIANGFVAIALASGERFSSNELVVFALAAELPLVASYVMWHRKSQAEDNSKDRAFSELAVELTKVSDKSEIVINAIADGVIAIDKHGIIQLINPAAQQILGWRQEDAIHLDYKSVLKLSNVRDEPLVDQNDLVMQALATNKPVVNNDVTLTTNSGKKLIISLLISPANMQASGAIVVFRDITKQKSEERQQAEFISTASHEMRTPVAAIEGYLGLALNPQTATIDDKARLYLTKAHESAEHLGRLFQDLLDVSRVDDNRLKNNPSVIDLVAFMGDITSMFDMKARQKGLVLLFKPIRGDTPNDLNRKMSPVYYTFADHDHLREVASNLIENAIKYTKQGSVTVDVEGDEDNVTISVSDSGIGIPAEDLPHLFQKFYRVDNTDTREIGGTGLGLYLCRRLVEAMNGKIWLESEYQKGSTFYIRFPRMLHEDAMKRLEEAEMAAMQNRPATEVQDPILQQAQLLEGQMAAEQKAAQAMAAEIGANQNQA